MFTNELETRIEKLQEWEALAAEAKSEADAIRDSIKMEMQNRNIEELEIGRFIVRWTSVTSHRFDSSAFKKIHGDLYNAFCKACKSKRFTISV